MGMNGMLKEGHKQLSGLEEATYKNIEAAKQLSSCVRTSLGPKGARALASASRPPSPPSPFPPQPSTLV